MSINISWGYTEIDPTRPVVGFFAVAPDKIFVALENVVASGRWIYASRPRDGPPWPTGRIPLVRLLNYIASLGFFLFSLHCVFVECVASAYRENTQEIANLILLRRLSKHVR